MSPITEADISSRSRKITLELKRSKGGKRVPGETNRVTMTAHSSPTMEDNRTAISPVQLHIIIKNMVKPERLPKAGNITACQILLPINPPEINALLLAHSHQVLKECSIKSRILQLPWNSCNTLIKAHVTSNYSKVIIAGADTVCRVKIEGCFSVVSMHPA